MRCSHADTICAPIPPIEKTGTDSLNPRFGSWTSRRCGVDTPACLAQAVDPLFQGLAVYAAETSGDYDGSVSGIPLEALPKLLGIIARLMPPRRGPITHVAVWPQADVSTGHLPTIITVDRASRNRIATETVKRCIPCRSTSFRFSSVDPSHQSSASGCDPDGLEIGVVHDVPDLESAPQIASQML